MLIAKTKKDLNTFLSSINTNNQLGLVPTMGALHQGHISLVRKAISENKAVVVSIFVNPTQFNNKEDLNKYPQNLEKDIALIREISDKIIVFAPSIKDIYSENVTSKSYNFEGLDKVMEGEFRDGHFNGVGTIVETLFNVVQPNKAYFGQKDFQQLQIIKKLVALQKIPVEIIGCPIVREANGLAMSSRNKRLSTTAREEAALIYKTLLAAKTKFGMKSAKTVIEWVQKEFKEHALFQLEYIKITDVNSLQSVQRKQKNKKYRAFIAVYVEDVRLIDNIALN